MGIRHAGLLHHSALRSSGTSPNFPITLASLKIARCRVTGAAERDCPDVTSSHCCSAATHSLFLVREQRISIYVRVGVFLTLPTGNGVGFKTTEFFKTGSRSA
jgi:hypothetical protein